MHPSPLGGLLRLHASDFTRIQRLLDPLAIVVLFFIGPGQGLPSLPVMLLPPWAWVVACSAFLLPRGRIYASYRQRSMVNLARRVTSSWCTVLTVLLLLTYLAKTTALFSRQDTILWAVSSWLFLLANHVGLRQLLRWHRSRGGNSRTIVYWGTLDALQTFAHELRESPWMGLCVVAWFGPEGPSPDGIPPHLPAFGGGLADMRRWLNTHDVDRIVFSYLPRGGVSMDQVVNLFGDTSLPVIYVPHWAKQGMLFRTDQIGSLHCIDLWGSEASLIDRHTKRCLDLSLSIIGGILISPLMMAIAIAVALSSKGPIFYSQDRYGLDGRKFRIYKFRTMSVMESGDQPGLKQATRDDPRVTRVGRFLRRWSLDELPQLMNVIRGEMSLVGPRPHAVDHNEYYRKLIPGYMQRHAFKPGITGLAQVEGWRGETQTLELMSRRIEADLRYQKNWNIGKDIKILVKTFVKAKSRAAY
ncbi:MAG: exopolysaccharide biosynthesis polyprenyl glycosylphosphotransferase [Cyanobacteriota bacterium]|nr:exopolysaccharide biosynthesis polyprenyl glycosylphosphotransferase [Cyanobacteriota bacterium]